MTGHVNEALSGMPARDQDDDLWPAGISTGFSGLDHYTHGLQASQLAVIASRPGIGRTALLVSILDNTAIRAGVPTLAITLEDSASEFAARVLSVHARVPLHDLGEWSGPHRRRLMAAWPEKLRKGQEALAASPLHICADPSMTMADVRRRAHEAVSQHGVKLIAIDGLTDIRPEKRNDMREREVGDVARDLKTLARELNVPVLVTTHLNRLPESRADKMPRIDDLRESGAVTFAADWIILLHRPDQYDRYSPRAGEIDMIVAKSRYYSRVGIQTAALQGDLGRVAPFVPCGKQWRHFVCSRPPHGPTSDHRDIDGLEWNDAYAAADSALASE